jgi:hypothetical protein
MVFSFCLMVLSGREAGGSAEAAISHAIGAHRSGEREGSSIDTNSNHYSLYLFSIVPILCA